MFVVDVHLHKKLRLQNVLNFIQKKLLLVLGKIPFLLCSDGGNDVGMIQSADVGIGIEGKEGK